MINVVLGLRRRASDVLRAARVLLAVVALAVLASGCGRLGHADADQPRAETVKIVRAVDGDTIRLVGSGDASRVRLIGEDTPRDAQARAWRGVRRAAGVGEHDRAAGRHRRGRLVSDPSQSSRDRYGRRLGYLEVAGRDVAETQIRRGWAIVYVYHERRFARYERYRAAQADAERHHRGVWGLCGGEFHRLAGG